ncbi:MAG: glycosyltransferase [Candidatus Omnitrophota bacterium]
MKIKICHFLNRLDVGGMENGVINICNRIDRKKFKPHICCIKGKGNMSLRLKSDVNVHTFNFPEGKSIFRPLTMINFFKKERFDIVHTHAWGACSLDGIIGARFAGVPVVINGEHGVFFLKKYQIASQRILAKLCDKTLSVSLSLKKEIKLNLGIPGNKICVIANGVDTNYFNGQYDISGVNEYILKRNINLNNDSFLIACVGSIKPSKNQKILIDAIIKLKNKNLIVLFVGDGPDRKILESYIDQNKLNENIIFLGQRDDVHKIYSFADLLVSSSIGSHEGLSNVMLEAMASGIPVISTESIGARELVREGETGFLIKSEDVGSLAEKIERFYSDRGLLKKMGDSAQKFIKENFSIDRMISEYEKLYLDLYNKKMNTGRKPQATGCKEQGE